MGYRIVKSYDAYQKKTVEHLFTDIRKSGLHQDIYRMTEFVRLSPLGEESAVDKEFKIGQSEGGYHGYYRSYLFIPAYWEFATLSAQDMAQAVEVYGNRIIYKRPLGPEGSGIDRHMCIGWSYDYGYEDEHLIGKQDIGEDTNNVIKDIVDWEWDYEPTMMTTSSISKVYDAIKALKVGIDKGIGGESENLLNGLMYDLSAFSGGIHI